MIKRFIILLFFFLSLLKVTTTFVQVDTILDHYANITVSLNEKSTLVIIYQSVDLIDDKLKITLEEKSTFHIVQLYRLLSNTNYSVDIFTCKSAKKHCKFLETIYLKTEQEDPIISALNAQVVYGKSTIPLWFSTYSPRQPNSTNPQKLLAFDSKARCVYKINLQFPVAIIATGGLGFDQNSLHYEYTFMQVNLLSLYQANGTLVRYSNACSLNHEARYRHYGYDAFQLVYTLGYNCWQKYNNPIPLFQTDDNLNIWNLSNPIDTLVNKSSLHDHKVPFTLQNGGIPNQSNLSDFNIPQHCSGPTEAFTPNTFSVFRADWSHANSINDGDVKNPWIIWGTRNLQTIFLLNPTTYVIEYYVGGPLSNFTILNARAQWWISHHAHVVAWDEKKKELDIIMHDDGVGNPNINTTRTRGLWIKLNFILMTLDFVQEYIFNWTQYVKNTSIIPPPAEQIYPYCYQQFFGSIEKLSNQNVAVLYSWCTGDNGGNKSVADGLHSYLVEYDSDAQITFVMQFDLKNLPTPQQMRAWFRILTFSSIGGEVIV